MKHPNIPSKDQLLSILKKSFNNDQSQLELRYITNELPSSLWHEAVLKRSQNYPLQYILGTQPFMELDLKVKEGVLIPRCDTEEWCAELRDVIDASKGESESLGKKLSVLDYCTGSGCIALSLAMAVNVGTVTGVDFNPIAVELSKENLCRNLDVINDGSGSKRIEFHQGDLFENDAGTSFGDVDLLVSNPPYIPKSELCVEGGVEESVLKFEPQDALLGDLEFYKRLSELVIHDLDKVSGFVFELGYLAQASVTRDILMNGKKGKESWECGIRADSAGRLRNVIGWRADGRLSGLGDMCDKIIT